MKNSEVGILADSSSLVSNLSDIDDPFLNLDDALCNLILNV